MDTSIYNKTIVYIVLSLLFIISPADAQTITISGTIRSQDTGESVIGASVYTADFEYGTYSNDAGKYVLKVDGHNKELIVSYIGFKSDTISLENTDKVINVSLRPDLLPEVIVTSKIGLENQIGKSNISAQELKRIPSLLGEVDIIKSLTMLPGISGSIEGSSGLIVRGGKSDQNLVLLDGIPIYNPAHLFGFISVFNPLSIKHVVLIKGGFPSKYGGRLSSILNVNLKEGNNLKYNTEVTLGLINSSFMTEGYIKKGKLSYVVAGRSTNMGILLAPLKLAYNAGTLDEYFSYWVTDLNVKLNYKIKENQRLMLSYYKGIDKLLYSTKKDLDESTSKTKWGNHGISLKYDNAFKSHLLFDAGIYINQYQYNQYYDIITPEVNRITNYLSDSKVHDFSFKTKLDWIHSAENISRIGVESNIKYFTPYNLKNIITDTLGTVKKNNTFEQDTKSENLSVFLDHVYQPTKVLKFMAGIRASFYKNDAYSFNSIEPRLSVNYFPNDNSVVKLAYDRMTQPIHNLSNTGIGIPNEIWVPATSKMKAGLSDQMSLGYSLNLPLYKSFISVEAYYKSSINATRLKHFTPLFFNTFTDWENQSHVNGQRRAYGLEFLFKKDVGKVTGWLGYTLSRSKSLFNTVNDNRWFLSDFSKTHELELTANYQATKKWSFGANFVFQSGRPITLPDAFVKDIFGNYSLSYSFINKYKTENYHRLDISATKSYLTKRNREAKWTFSIYNVYAHANPIYYEANLNSNTIINSDIVEFTAQKVSILNFIPSFSYSIKF